MAIQKVKRQHIIALILGGILVTGCAAGPAASPPPSPDSTMATPSTAQFVEWPAALVQGLPDDALIYCCLVARDRADYPGNQRYCVTRTGGYYFGNNNASCDLADGYYCGPAQLLGHISPPDLDALMADLAHRKLDQLPAKVPTPADRSPSNGNYCYLYYAPDSTHVTTAWMDIGVPLSAELDSLLGNLPVAWLE